MSLLPFDCSLHAANYRSVPGTGGPQEGGLVLLPGGLQALLPPSCLHRHGQCHPPPPGPGHWSLQCGGGGAQGGLKVGFINIAYSHHPQPSPYSPHSPAFFSLPTSFNGKSNCRFKLSTLKSVEFLLFYSEYTFR